MDLSLGFVDTLIERLLNPEHLVVLLAGPISHTSTQYMDFVEIFNISLDLSTIYFAHFSGCWAFFVYSCHSILECYNLFSGVRLSIRSFLLFPEKNKWDSYRSKNISTQNYRKHA